MSALDLAFRFLRVVWPILRPPILKLAVVTRSDDVREVLLDNVHFHTEQTPRLNVLMDNTPFMLGLDDPEAFKASIAPMKAVVRPGDAQRLAAGCRKQAVQLIAQAAARGGRLEVVDFVRQITLDVFSKYTGVTQPAGHDLQIMTTRWYEFQVTPVEDQALKGEAESQAKALRAHIDGLIRNARNQGPNPDDILGRLLIYQSRNKGTPSDAEIRANLIGLLVGALPQLPIGAPQALDQLLSRPCEQAAAMAAARVGDDATVGRYLSEAARFDPLAPMLFRRCVQDREIAGGAFRRTTIKEGDLVVAALLSAMKDPRRVADPERFDPDRGPATYLHFGYGIHACLFERINPVIAPAMLGPLLACDDLARASGRSGKLVKRRVFADQLWVTFTPP